ncbi:hypothetical protein EDL79_04120 [Ehrlichia ruminantium]|uniref:Uncharacterized protein n=1 Tax=Ehrlichia ruminantium TaxID=779 RepID=A0AAE6QB60_EHRRU|nr:hypothetical protein [Ehrlichia ruminantium]QGR02799.1 hypothetical protein EDL81_04100 [Ehrlichia ruminantium]QGR03723.1 hypothetical protein EDL80_04110 [Ehrlichia ruminantium]QGR04650.1 hypothetical protein EDL79_04120 [Ehrlichia ruminantium]
MLSNHKNKSAKEDETNKGWKWKYCKKIIKNNPCIMCSSDCSGGGDNPMVVALLVILIAVFALYLFVLLGAFIWDVVSNLCDKYKITPLKSTDDCLKPSSFKCNPKLLSPSSYAAITVPVSCDVCS